MSGSSAQHMYGRYGQYDYSNTHPSYGYGQHASTGGWPPGYPSSPAYDQQPPQYGPQPYPSAEHRQSNEQQDRKRKREDTPESERNVADKSKKLDWPFLRVFLLDNAAVLLQNLCPRLYGLGTINNAGSKERKYALILLLTQNSQAHGKRWRAAVTCDGVIVIEGPERVSSDLAVEDLQESVAARLSRVVPRAWEPKKDIHTGSGNVGMEEDGTGTKFLSERVGGRGFGKRN
ncbi:hypothetical protein D0864_08860 [Hortaea werneckii]|uniref:Uncharacterized protein n=1 Tax=Hortaea werneckii TaxID=91943 RepID=A0A3M7ETX2_HORWE|nr:hypothetical protein KC352_g16365 [Hortaea werneckii]KAI7564846.1 hypothetical protein KC317_g6772 [Hortaea werneckii]KAI7615471.1 hypothetical protein KC346_g6438 [Hortaea werneckii]KAI7676938.1 hypothetical protein KC322_g15320 [Hortaea werneckii]RMY79972.1 hypothetical protein D0864_08860 [Hortaea werneckii]